MKDYPTMVMTCDYKGCKTSMVFEAKTSQEAFNASEYFRKQGWVIHEGKNYCAGCAVEVAAKTHNAKAEKLRRTVR